MSSTTSFARWLTLGCNGVLVVLVIGACATRQQAIAGDRNTIRLAKLIAVRVPYLDIAVTEGPYVGFDLSQVSDN